MTDKSIFYLVALIIEIIGLICIAIVIYNNISKKEATTDHLNDILLQFSLKAILPTLVIFISTFICEAYVPETLLFAYLLYWFNVYWETRKNKAPSSLKIPSSLRPYYWQVASTLGFFRDSQTSFEICDAARKHLYSSAIGSDRPSLSGYNTMLKNDIYDEKSETWALCFILYYIEIELVKKTEDSEVIKMFVENRLGIRHRFAPIEFLDKFRDCKFINDLYEKHLKETSNSQSIVN